ncbi:hypothetical protein Ait01nite_051910 [Actinoplanes italicus]|nr:hypothetical protein Ait01nite_051910 [Actinoplanes italicus]
MRMRPGVMGAEKALTLLRKPGIGSARTLPGDGIGTGELRAGTAGTEVRAAAVASGLRTVAMGGPATDGVCWIRSDTPARTRAADRAPIGTARRRE